MGVAPASADPATPDAAVLRRFGEQVRVARRALGWSQERLADECGLHWSYIGQIERGKRNVGLLNIVRVAKALDVSPAALLEGSDLPI
ncbi:MAG TPA: helix-turn-helix transcriptional regulator [Acidimicrobiales bacterium]|nr:helix-turn-helix transcriptional regulator [Acidimicrobiales bacterium]